MEDGYSEIRSLSAQRPIRLLITGLIQRPLKLKGVIPSAPVGFSRPSGMWKNERETILNKGRYKKFILFFLLGYFKSTLKELDLLSTADGVKVV